jgi:hypothetical protein
MSRSSDEGATWSPPALVLRGWALGGNLRCVDRHDGAEFELTLPLEPPSFGR